jgi:hypothetical protein
MYNFQLSNVMPGFNNNSFMNFYFPFLFKCYIMFLPFISVYKEPTAASNEVKLEISFDFDKLLHYNFLPCRLPAYFLYRVSLGLMQYVQLFLTYNLQNMKQKFVNLIYINWKIEDQFP